MTPEQKIRKEVRNTLEGRGWGVFLTHGNRFQSGFPDAFVAHAQFGTRWIDFKVAGKYSFTKAQKQLWPLWHYKFRVGIWILTDGSEEQYRLLFESPNWESFWRQSWGNPKEIAKGFDISDLVEQLNEEWKNIPGYVNKYQISDHGSVVNVKTGRKLKTYLTVGYPTVELDRNKRDVRHIHVLVLEMFIGPRPINTQACHNDGCKTNNHFTNLRWASAHENSIDTIYQGRGQNILEPSDVLKIFNSDENEDYLMSQFGVSQPTINDIKTGKSWSHLTKRQYGRKRLTKSNVLKIREQFEQGESKDSLAEEFDTTCENIRRIIKRERWKNV